MVSGTRLGVLTPALGAVAPTFIDWKMGEELLTHLAIEYLMSTDK